MEFHKHLIFGPKESIELTEIKDKTTVVMATCQADIKILMWSIFSLLLRGSYGSNINHFSICINGPSKKDADQSIQNTKQDFFEKLILDHDISISIFRIMGRTGHAHSIDSCIPWIHTEYYTLVHDDVILLKDWREELDSSGYSADEKRSIISYPPLIICPIKPSIYKDELKLGIPHLNSSFVNVKNSVLEGLGVRWHGYHVPFEFSLNDDFINYYKDISNNTLNKDQKFKYQNTDVGSFVWYNLLQNDYKFYTFSKDLCVHLRESSWSNQVNMAIKINKHINEIDQLEREIKNSRYKEIYEEFCVFSNIIL